MIPWHRSTNPNSALMNTQAWAASSQFTGSRREAFSELEATSRSGTANKSQRTSLTPTGGVGMKAINENTCTTCARVQITKGCTKLKPRSLLEAGFCLSDVSPAAERREHGYTKLRRAKPLLSGLSFPYSRDFDRDGGKQS